MLAVSAQNQRGIFEKVVRAKDGRLFAVRFVVIETSGQFRARIISAAQVIELGCRVKGIGYKGKKKKEKPILLNGSRAPSTKPQALSSFPFVSPFVSELEFFVSQMTRAPSC